VSANDDIETRVRRIEDDLTIRQVMARYCHFANRGWEGAGDDHLEQAALFTEDAVWWPAGGGGPQEGRSSMLARLETIRSREFGNFVIHHAFNPRIEIDGDRAVGDWHALIALTADDGRSVWVSGVYHEDLVRTHEGWRIKALRFFPAFITPYEGGGWAIEPDTNVRR
jgi:hypothetical protein